MPTPIVTRLRFTVRDGQGRTSNVKFWWSFMDETTIAPTVSVLKADLQALTSGQVWSYIDVPPDIIPRPASTQYVSAQDKAELVFQDSKAAFHRLQVPAPLLALFAADQITVNPANAALVTFVAAMLTGASSSAGTPYTSFVGGIYIRRKLPRRFSITVLAPDGTTPAE